jgi:uncharacterized delta-60 repeat protein/M6 family metalloprotease-like protein
MKTRLEIGLLAGSVALAGLTFVLWHQGSVPGSPAVASANASVPAPKEFAAPVPASPAAPAVRPGPFAKSGCAARDVIASGWKTETQPAFAGFRDWTIRYLAASPEERARLLPEGVQWAQERRAVLAQLIRSDPQSALAAAVPMVVRQQLPAEVTALLEERITGRGELSLLAVTPAPGQTVTEPIFRSALIDRQEYRAYVYGRREAQATVAATSIVGIAVDRSLAVSESPLRVLEPGELAAGRPLDVVCSISGISTPVDPAAPLNVTTPTAVEYNGKIQVLCHVAHVAALEQRLVAAEVDHIQTAADNQAGSSGVTGRPTLSWTHGTKKVLIIRVDFPDLPGVNKILFLNDPSPVPLTEDIAVNLFNDPNGVRDFYAQSSYGATALQIAATVAGNSPDVTPVLRMPATAVSYATAGNNDLLHSDARAAALAAGYNEANYDRIGVVFSHLDQISGTQITYGGLGQVIGKYFWVNGYYVFNIIAHEIGHNYGLNHANLWQVTDSNPISPTGTSTEYGDPFDIMGDGSTFQNDFSDWNKSILQWIPDTAVTLATASGTFRVYRFDNAAAANLANPRALKVVRDATRDYWIGYRHGSGNASLNSGAYVLWGYNANQQADLLDMTTPGVNPSGNHDEGLAIGTTFTDAVAGITIKPLDQGGSGAEEYLDVQIGFQSKVQWSQSTYYLDEKSGNAILTLSRSQSSTGIVSVNYATAPGTATANVDYTTSSGTVTWLDGDMADKTISIPVIADSTVDGTENFTVTLSGASGGVIGVNQTATVNVVDAGVRDASFTADFVNAQVEKVLPLPDGSMVLGGWFNQIADTSFNNLYTRTGSTRLTATGAADPTFAASGGTDTTPVYDLARQPDGRIIAVGNFTTFNGTASNRIVRLLPDGSVDSSFNPGTGANGTVYAVLLQPDGKIIIGGEFTSYNGTARQILARLNSDGSLDTGFTGPAFVSGFWSVHSLALQSDGKLLVGGIFYLSASQPFKSGICRVLTTGALDPAFNGITNGAHGSGSTLTLKYIYKIVVQPDGKILIGGDFTAFNGTTNLRGGVARLTTTGSLDGTFTGPTTISTSGAVKTILFQPDGSMLIGGSFTTLNGTASNHLARISSTGAVDAAFAAAGGFGTSGSTVEDLALLPNGQVLLAGSNDSFQSSSGTGPVWRFFPGLAGSPGTIQFLSATYSGDTGTTATLSVTRTGGSLGALTVGYATLSGTATTADYTAAAGVLTWTDGDASTKTISIPLTADVVSDPTESFTVNLGQPLIGGALLGAIQQTTVSIFPFGSGPPAITTQPASQIATVGFPVTFTVTASGIPTPTFQWKKDAAIINGATGSSYSIAHVAVGDAGTYTVVATNSAGSAISNPASLTIKLAPTSGYRPPMDFNGSGKSGLIWQNSVTGERSVWLMNGTTVTQGVSLGLSPTEWSIAAIADFNGDGKPDLLWQNTLTGDRVFWLMNGTTFLSSVDLGVSSPDWSIACAGDFNGDGQTDLVWQNTSTGERTIWLMNGTTVASTVALGTFPPEWSIAATGDFNADGQTDLLWQNTVTGEKAIWLMQGTTVTAGVSLGIFPHLQLAGTGDYNGDGQPDIIWTNTSTGERGVWLMNGTTIASTVSLGVVDQVWTLIRPLFRRALCDFNNDGKSDLVWQNTTTGDRAFWIMNGTSARFGVSLGNFPTNQWIAAIGDFNNDGKADLVWQNLTTGAASISLMNGATVLSGVSLGTSDPTWRIATTGDFNGDGKPDILWTNTVTGDRVIWLMDGTAFTGGVDLGVVSTQQQIVGTGDYNGDGQIDIVWQNTVTGERHIWFMNGSTFVSSLSLGTYDTAWSIVGTGDYSGDGKPDLLWQNTSTGDRVIWLMDGTTFINSVDIGTYDTAWSIRN